MLTTTAEPTVETLHIKKDTQIAATPAVVFETLLEQLGPNSEMPDSTPFPMKLEPWPGGRWFRDLGNNTGHLWGHVQVIKPPQLIELWGPMFMSYAAVSHIQYRLTAEGGGTRLSFVHRAIGQITPEHREGVSKGWEYRLKQLRETSERKAKR